ncbi:MAG: CBS domain-containing protein, partial [Deltaproteobacteria bacterium]|nr:CBS domain-containing protein [Deltaproteobacteria bacterium]
MRNFAQPFISGFKGSRVGGSRGSVKKPLDPYFMEVITTHINADFDTLASMLAAKKLYPEAHLVFPGSQEKGLRDFFLKSTLYAFDIERVKDIDLDKVTRLILVDIRQRSRIGVFSNIIGKPGLDIHIYDHHPSSTEDIHGSLEVTHPYGSTTTILTLILKEKMIEITPEEATIMMLGIYEDTGSLIFPSTTIRDYEAAAFLLSKGANLNIVSDMLTKELTVDEVALLNELIENATTYTIDGVDVVIAEATSSRYTGDIASLVHRLESMENINCLFVLAWMEDRVHIVARSRLKEVNVGEIAQALGGGGHPTAASATLRDVTLIQARERLINVLREMIAHRKFTRDIMSSPAITISSESTIEETKDTLTRYNINAIPVMRGNVMVGIITRQVVEKALYHGLKDVPVRDYMNPDFEAVNTLSPLPDVQEAIIGHNQRLLPVIEEGKVVGVITRTDLFRALREELTEKPYPEDTPRRHKVVTRLMEERLPQWVVRMLKDAGRVAEGLGYKAYAVGGFVRDLLLRYENLDIDIVIEGDGIAFANEFGRLNNCRVRSHPKFGTAVVIFPDGFKVDVATARLEYYERPGALPTVELSSIKLDLYRRDFTINTLAIALNPKGFGELLDFFGGQRDIKEKTIKVLHNLSFVEDPTRVFRAIRFAERFGFRIGKHTTGLIKNTVRLNLFQKVSGGRLLDELRA